MINLQILEIISAFIVISAFYIQGQAYFKPSIYAQAIQSLLIAILALYIGLSVNAIDYIFLAIAIIILRAFLLTIFLLRGLRKKPGIRERTRGVASELVINLS
ncbi:MAG: hydrogenase, partial [Saccharolobus sp.]